MKSLHDHFGEARAANKRRRRAHRDEADEDTLARVEAAYWAKREALKAARARWWRAWIKRRGYSDEVTTGALDVLHGLECSILAVGRSV